MKKSTIWLLASVMAFAFFGLLYLQVNYIRDTIKSRSNQFDEAVSRSLYQVMRDLELEQTRRYLEQGYIESEKKDAAYNKHQNSKSNSFTQRQRMQLSLPDGSAVLTYDYSSTITQQPSVFISPKHGNKSISKTSFEMQEDRKKRYFYQKDLVDDVINNILYKASSEPINKRIDYKDLNASIKAELANNGIVIPFQFKIVDKDEKDIYSQTGFDVKNKNDLYSQVLFQNDPPAQQYHLEVNFPTRGRYIVSAISFFVPSVAFTIVLLVTFIVTIYLIFRQKKLSEMKNDFINNMTHELKTPVSTISLAAQMLKDGSVMKSPEVFKHISGVINDETKRLSFQVEKVLQMSLFEKQKATLKLKEMDVNDIIVSVANTFQLKVEKFGGEIDIDLQAEDSTAEVDEMHFTNVLFNLLDNAVKYRKEEVPLKLMIKTWNENGKLFISVDDNGIGIKKEYVKKIFERFYRIPTGNRHDVKGFGLGLAYVFKIVKDHKGSIKAESELGLGTKFIINLPIIK
ncbi:MAG: HAMP domain-containing sensor histidine kinase [Dysgonamonadaceae bacterium]